MMGEFRRSGHGPHQPIDQCGGLVCNAQLSKATLKSRGIASS